MKDKLLNRKEANVLLSYVSLLMEVRMDVINKEKTAKSELGGLIKYNKPSSNISRSFHQPHTLNPLGFLLKQITKRLYSKIKANLMGAHHGQ